MDQVRLFLQKHKTTGYVLIILGVFMLMQIVAMIALRQDFPKFFEKMTIPMDFGEFIRQPWSLFTHWAMLPLMPFFLIFFEALVFYFVSTLYKQFMGDAHLRGVLIFAILINSLLAIAFANIIIPDQKTAHFWGLNNIIITLIVALATRIPNYPVRLLLFGTLRFVWIAVGIVLINLLMYRAFFTLHGISTIVSAGMGYALIKLMESGNDLTQWFQWGVPKERSRFRKARETVPARPSEKRPGAGRFKVVKAPEMSDEEILDRLLDKISEVGYNKLSRKEKETLDKLSGKK